ncbi:hypothetical protein [Oryzobacter telluris]|uniref:hypothetical protein n=1 Tax=Oryzobacter telluris TaxID=3149179 RepID=UPI00370D9FD4
MGAERWDEQVGSVADEAARLLESLRRTAAEAAAGADDGAGSAPPPAADPADPGPGAASSEAPGCSDPFCQWCPLCRTSAVVRSLSPETLSRLADLAGVAAAVLADLASARTREAPAASSGATATEDDRADRPGRARPIPVRDADDPQEDPRG